MSAILQRLDKLEKENASLKKELNHLEGSHAAPAHAMPASAGPPAPPVAPAAAYGAPPPPLVAQKVPVQYVQACNIYGEGFIYIPGTQACIKVGGYIRLQGVGGGSGDGTVNGADNMAPQGRNNRLDTSNINYDARAVMSLDVRVPTALGPLRGYARFGAEQDTPLGSSWTTTVAQPAQSSAPSLFWDRGYVQFLGFTVGKARSFFDIFSASDGFLTYGNLRTNGDTDLTGVILAAYTYQWGNGFTSTLSVEDPNGHFKVGVSNLGIPEFGLGTLGTDNGYQSGSTANQGMGVPDIIGNLRVDQSWGYAGISAALHQVAAGYYGGSLTGVTPLGYPSDKFGWAVGGGGDIFVPTGPSDTLGVNAVYSQGAVDFATKGNRWQLYNGNSAGLAWGVDGVYDNTGVAAPGSSIELTSAWSINAGYEHHWSDQWKTSVYGGYAAVMYDQAAKNMINQHLPGAAGTVVCGVPVEGAVQPPLAITPGGGNSCTPDYSFWQVGSRTQFSPVNWLDLGVDVTYTRLNTAYAGAGVGLGVNGAMPAGTYTIADQNVWTVMGRAQFNFETGK